MHKTLFYSFIKKIGETSFNKIKNRITIELSNNISISKCSSYEDYLIYIFEIAFFKYCGVKIEKIPFIINQMVNDYIPVIPFNDFIDIHQVSIDNIIEYFEQIYNQT